MHHLAFALSQATFAQTVERLDERGIKHSGVKDRGFMDSIYFTDPLGLLIELASYRFEPPAGCTHADVLLEAHRLRVERGDHHIDRDASRRRDRAAHRALDSHAVRRPLAEGPLPLICASRSRGVSSDTSLRHIPPGSRRDSERPR